MTFNSESSATNIEPESDLELRPTGQLFSSINPSAPNGISGWAGRLVKQMRSSPSLTIGLTNGSRGENDRRIINELASEISRKTSRTPVAQRILVLNSTLHPTLSLTGGRIRGTNPVSVDSPKPSPLGRWYETNVELEVGMRAGPVLESLPQTLPEWKRQFGMILIDLGPIHLVPSRVLGRLCDQVYVLLGPSTCASHDWLRRHIAWHEQCGTQFAGSLLANFSRAA